MVINIETVLKVYASLLDGRLSYSDADRWAFELIQLNDDKRLEFEPRQEEKLLWELIIYLAGIDMPSVKDRSKTMIGKDDIIDFLKKKGVYGFINKSE